MAFEGNTGFHWANGPAPPLSTKQKSEANSAWRGKYAGWQNNYTHSYGNRWLWRAKAHSPVYKVSCSHVTKYQIASRKQRLWLVATESATTGRGLPVTGGISPWGVGPRKCGLQTLALQPIIIIIYTYILWLRPQKQLCLNTHTHQPSMLYI